tara:strand:+ start:647 stop:1144 length:498 start_codon:yes stop_codon:yes gene_type:complete
LENQFSIDGDAEEFGDSFNRENGVFHKRNPLVCAIRQNNVEMVQWLLDHGANPCVVSDDLLYENVVNHVIYMLGIDADDSSSDDDDSPENAETIFRILVEDCLECSDDFDAEDFLVTFCTIRADQYPELLRWLVEQMPDTAREVSEKYPREHSILHNILPEKTRS